MAQLLDRIAIKLYNREHNGEVQNYTWLTFLLALYKIKFSSRKTLSDEAGTCDTPGLNRADDNPYS